jgi:RNA polymerase sigma-70 factor (ECF subfamily)
MRRGRPGDATEPQQPGSTGTGQPLPARREAAADAASRGAIPAAQARAASSDSDLLKMHVEGDPEAFGELFLRHRDRLWAVAVRTLADPEDAADALQEAMISAFRRAASFRGESAVTTWLHRIVVNACLDRMRRRSARPEVAGGDERLLDVLASSDYGSDPAAGSELSIEVMAALRHLPHDQQVALVLVDMLEYPVADAAELLGVAQGTVKSRCARGRARLLPRLAHLRQAVGAPSGPGAARRGDGLPAGGTAGPVSGTSAPGAFTEPSAESEQEKRNRIPPGSVLPAQKGGDDEE